MDDKRAGTLQVPALRFPRKRPRSNGLGSAWPWRRNSLGPWPSPCWRPEREAARSVLWLQVAASLPLPGRKRRQITPAFAWPWLLHSAGRPTSCWTRW